MDECIVLTKIAKIFNRQETINNDDKIITFQHEDKTWILLASFKDDANTIMKLKGEGEINKAKEFSFVTSQDGQHLVIVYRNNVRSNRYTLPLIDRLLDSIYSNVKRCCEDAATHANKVLKTYVTTELFEALQKEHVAAKVITQQMLDTLSLPPKFLPTLCEYQKQSVLWLLGKEQCPDQFPDFFEQIVAKDNETVVYKHLYSRYIQTEPPPKICLPPGGILADEMGLGKTVEMLALILLNRRYDANLYNDALSDFFINIMAKRKCMDIKIFCICTSNSKKRIIQCNKCYLWQHKHCVGFYNDEHDLDDVSNPYLCPKCWQIAIDECGLLKTKATLIVSPNTIKLQWLSEIQRHIEPTLRVFLYDGINSGKWVSPRQLGEYDVVLTDYSVLRGEIYFTQDNVSERTTRNKPRSIRMNTPILMLDWWRVLLDEAQMVESNTSKTASLVRMIPAVNRWAVTGTPIQKSLNDLQPLLQFIGFDAASDLSTWNCLVNDFVLQQEEQNSENYHNTKNKPVPELIKVLQKCMWRTCKTQIASELKIPPQMEIIHRLEFDNLEKLFYNEQHAECRSNFIINVHKYTKRIKTISPQIMKTILQPFLKIRQSCTMPVVVTNTSANKNLCTQQQKQFLQPKELNDYLKSSNEISCKSELRAMASSHNGLAALYFLRKQYDQAIKHYESVLKLANDYNDMNVVVDSLLQIHALHNIMQIKVIQNPQTEDLNLETFEKQYNALEWKYLGTYASTLATVRSSFEAAVGKIKKEITDNFVRSMAGGFQNLPTNDESLLLQKIHEEGMLRFGQTNLKLPEIHSTGALLYVVQLWFQKLSSILKDLLHEIDELKYFSDNVRSRNQVSPAIWRYMMHLVNTVYDCHLSEIREIPKPNKKPEKNKKLCKMCCIRDSINNFECLLFDKVIDKNTNFTEGLENPSFEMFLCKLTFSFLKNKQRASSDDFENNWLYLENLQLVCKRLIKLWIEMEFTIKAYDELNMCKMRITLTDDPDDKSIFKIREHEIEGRIVEQQHELMTAQTQFTGKLARLRYIKHLEGDEDLGTCPICRLNEDARYAVLECGHHICYPCLKSIRQYAKGSQFKCSICRNVQQIQNIYYVSRTKSKINENDKIKGDYSSKITYIVRLILKLLNDSDLDIDGESNSDIKILIFSQWEPILLSIAMALKENDIKFRAQCTAKTIEEFKNPKLGITCLLMPFIRGSKGLNLVEATHVFLVEPILNPGEELQAIGRVHRFGQTRSTTVHRFIVSDSIEENIYNFIISSSSKTNGIQRRWEFDNISLKDFENLFSLEQINECD